MAVLGRLLVSSSERLDLPDLLSIDSYAAGDWRYFIKGLVGGNKPFILKGFDVIDPQGAIGTTSCSIRVAESVTFYPGSSSGPFYHGLEEGNTNAVPLVPELRADAVNYVYLTFSTFNTSVDTRAFWDPDKDGGSGGEFTQDINTESVLQVQVNVSTGSFPVNTIPIAKISVNADNAIQTIEDARDMLFRLGTGGITPDPHSTYNFRSLPSPSYTRSEPPTLMSDASDPNPFQGADKNIYSLKEWMDVVMTKLKELGGTQFWYENTSTFSITNIFHDVLTTTFKSKGSYLHDSSIPGKLTWSEDIIIKSVSDPRDIIVKSGDATLTNEQVAYLSLIRDSSINTLDQSVSWTYGANYVNAVGGSIGFFAKLVKGDWIKKISDGAHLFLQVIEFYDSTNLLSAVTTPAGARSIRLDGTYQGTTAVDKARYDKGVYLSSNVVVQDRSNAAITATATNFSWIAQRSDTIEKVLTVQGFTASGTLSNADGSTAKISSTAAHGLVDGDRIQVTAPGAQVGTYTVDVEDANTFYISTSNTSTGAFTGFYSLLTTTTRDNSYGLQLESANHGFESGETVTVSGTTNFDGPHVINKRSATQIQFPMGSAPALVSTGLATLARMDVRTEKGITKVLQGETIDIGEKDSDNIQKFVGMTSLADTHPTYFIPNGYGTLSQAANYNSDPTDNLTLRASKLTAMMGDKAQDKTVKYITSAERVVNTTNGSAQEITFTPTSSTLTLLQPGSPGNATITLPDTTPGISLLVNQSAYVVINRDAASTPSIVVTNTATVPIGENVFVIASRLSDFKTYLWDGTEVQEAIDLVPNNTALVKVRLYDLADTTLPIGTVVVDNITVTAGDLVLFSALSSNNNRVYQALGTLTNITGWQVQHIFNGLADPTDGDTTIVKDGQGYDDRIGVFTGSTWVFNDKVRYFNGVDYWEQSNLVTSTLLDNTTANVFTVNFSQSEYMVIDYSITRGTSRETGTIHVTTDHTTVNVTTSGAYLNTSGITFSGDISGLLLRLRYTTTSTGNSATMKYMIRRWANGAGGPGGVPSYSGFAGTSLVGAGASGSIQYNNGGLIDGNSNFKIDTLDLSVNLNGLRQSVLSSDLTIADNTAAPTSLFTFSATDYKFAIIEYSIVRNGNYRVGRLLVANDGSITTDNDDYVETGATGVSLTADILGSNVRILYTSTNLGFSGTLKYSMRRWT